MPVGTMNLLGEYLDPEPEDRLEHRKETGMRSVGDASPREDAPEVLVGMVAVPKSR